MKKIYYIAKSTSAGTIYVELKEEDRAELTRAIIAVLTYTNELSISKNRDVKPYIEWFHKSSRNWGFNSKLKRDNSPASYLGGVLNNLLFGTQRDFTLNQLETVALIINAAIDVLEVIEDIIQSPLQTQYKREKMLIVADLFEE